MGLVYADIELINSGDQEMVRRGVIGEEEVKCINVNMLVDTGSIMLAINENIQEYLQLPVIRTRKAQLANGHIVECNVVGPVMLKFKNREAICSALVLPGDAEPLLGAIPLEEMDVLVDPQRNELVVHPDHPDFALMKLKKQLLAPAL
jgi:clan AA aspartic protease